MGQQRSGGNPRDRWDDRRRDSGDEVRQPPLIAKDRNVDSRGDLTGNFATGTGDVLSCATQTDVVVANTAFQCVVAAFADQDVVAAATDKSIVAGSSLDDVVATAGADDVVATACLDDVAIGGTEDDVVAIGWLLAPRQVDGDQSSKAGGDGDPRDLRL